MKCPSCGYADTQVIDSRVSEEGDTIRRRRRCLACDRRFTTYERVERLMPVVVKRNGTRVEFDIEKLRSSLRLALRKRHVSATAVDTAVAHIQDAILNASEKEIYTQHIGELVMSELKLLDQVAYVRYASVYKSFKDLDEFARAITEVQSQAEKQVARRIRATSKHTMQAELETQQLPLE